MNEEDGQETSKAFQMLSLSKSASEERVYLAVIQAIHGAGTSAAPQALYDQIQDILEAGEVAQEFIDDNKVVDPRDGTDDIPRGYEPHSIDDAADIMIAMGTDQGADLLMTIVDYIDAYKELENSEILPRAMMERLLADKDGKALNQEFKDVLNTPASPSKRLEMANIQVQKDRILKSIIEGFSRLKDMGQSMAPSPDNNDGPVIK